MPATDRSEVPAPTRSRASSAWMAAAVLGYAALGWLGRQTIVEGHDLSLVWPAAGAASLILVFTPVRWWPLSAALVAATTYLSGVLGGAPGDLAAVFAVVAVGQAVVAVLVLRALVPDLDGVHTRVRAVQVRDFWGVLAACSLAAVTAAVLGAGGALLVEGGGTWADLVVWWGRNVSGSVAIVTTGVLLARVVAARSVEEPRRGRLGEAWSAEVGEEHRLELALLVGATLLLYLSVFVWYDALPVAFPLLVPTVWAGLRFSPLTTALHSITVSALVVVFTLHDDGPFARVGGWHAEALVSQTYIALVFCLGMLLSLGRADRIALTRVLHDARAASERQALMMAAVIESMHDGLTLVDATGAVLVRNEAGASIARADDGHDTDVTQYVMTDPAGRELSHDEMPQIRVFQTDGVLIQDVVLRFNDGSPSRTVSISARRLPSEAGPSDQAVLIYHDVTQDRAQRSALESFAGVVAHDLRGPLAIIEGWSELLELDLESGPLSREDGLAKVQHIQTASAAMRQLIGDLLDSSTSREQQLRSTVVDLGAVATSVAGLRTSVRIEEPPLIEVGPLPPAYADAAMVRQLFDNLVNNAVKYVVPGRRPEISITGRSLGDMVEVSVSDHGIGIPAGERERIFEPFHRVTTEATYAGHGIGLSVCQKIVERHGGRISARPPHDGVGTRIVFTLPAAPGQ